MKHNEIGRGLVGTAIVLCVSLLAVKFNNPNLLWWYILALFLF